MSFVNSNNLIVSCDCETLFEALSKSFTCHIYLESHKYSKPLSRHITYDISIVSIGLPS